MKTIIALCAISMLSACVNLKGELQVTDHLIFKKGGKTEILMAGDYKADAKVKKDKLTLKLKGDFEKKTLTLKFPKGTILPQDNGTLNYTATQLGQPFGLDGQVVTTVETGDVRSETETCRYSVMYDYCGPYNYGTDGRYYGPHTACHSVPVWGKREVKFHFQTKVSTLEFDLTQNDQAKAHFSGQDVESKKVYDYVGPCRL